jgi:hypothetical protein
MEHVRSFSRKAQGFLRVNRILTSASPASAKGLNR